MSFRRGEINGWRCAQRLAASLRAAPRFPFEIRRGFLIEPPWFQANARNHPLSPFSPPEDSLRNPSGVREKTTSHPPRFSTAGRDVRSNPPSGEMRARSATATRRPRCARPGRAACAARSAVRGALTATPLRTYCARARPSLRAHCARTWGTWPSVPPSLSAAHDGARRPAPGVMRSSATSASRVTPVEGDARSLVSPRRSERGASQRAARGDDRGVVLTRARHGVQTARDDTPREAR